MTKIQHKTFNAASSGLSQHKGQQDSFLLPALESSLRLGRIPGLTNHTIAGGNENNAEIKRLTVKQGGIAILILILMQELAIHINIKAQAYAVSHANADPNKVHHQQPYRVSTQVMYDGFYGNVDSKKLETYTH